MSTPIHQLPTQPSTKSQPVEDPEVLSMLSEMEHEVEEATKQQHQPVHVPPPQMLYPPSQMPAPVMKTARKGIWNQDMAQKAVVFAAIALVLFYPATLKFVYSKIPKFEALLTSYDMIIRGLLLAVALYFAMMYLPF